MAISKEDRVTKTGRMNPSPYLRILQLIDSKYGKDERGDLLIFLSGQNEIACVEEVIREYALQNQRWIILPLHSCLSVAEQDQVFDYPPEGVRKCIISTNIAETSITLGIWFQNIPFVSMQLFFVFLNDIRINVDQVKIETFRLK